MVDKPHDRSSAGSDTPNTEQGCYDVGYDNPAKSSRDFKWQHVVDVNAYRCGQLDRQNQQPRNRDYRREDYEADTFERKPPPVILGEPQAALACRDCGNALDVAYILSHPRSCNVCCPEFGDPRAPASTMTRPAPQEVFVSAAKDYIRLLTSNSAGDHVDIYEARASAKRRYEAALAMTRPHGGVDNG